jgi:hypothetical protein
MYGQRIAAAKDSLPSDVTAARVDDHVGARHERSLAGGEEEAASASSSGFPSLSIGVQLIMYPSGIAAFLDLRSWLCGNLKLGLLFQVFQCGSSHTGGAQTLRSTPDAGCPAVREEWNGTSGYGGACVEA